LNGFGEHIKSIESLIKILIKFKFELSTLNVKHTNLCISNDEMQITTRTLKKRKIPHKL